MQISPDLGSCPPLQFSYLTWSVFDFSYHFPALEAMGYNYQIIRFPFYVSVERIMIDNDYKLVKQKRAGCRRLVFKGFNPTGYGLESKSMIVSTMNTRGL